MNIVMVLISCWTREKQTGWEFLMRFNKIRDKCTIIQQMIWWLNILIRLTNIQLPTLDHKHSAETMNSPPVMSFNSSSNSSLTINRTIKWLKNHNISLESSNFNHWIRSCINNCRQWDKVIRNRNTKSSSFKLNFWEFREINKIESPKWNKRYRSFSKTIKLLSTIQNSWRMKISTIQLKYNSYKITFINSKSAIPLSP